MVQLFFAWRIHVLTSNFLLVAIVVALALASGGTFKSILTLHPYTANPLVVCAFVTTWEVMVITQFVRFQEFRVSRTLSF